MATRTRHASCPGVALMLALLLACGGHYLASRNCHAFAANPYRRAVEPKVAMLDSKPSSSSATPPASDMTTASNDSTLIALAKEFLTTGTGLYSALRPELYAEDFIFRGGGVIGPLNKVDYLRTMRILSINDAWNPEPNFFGFTVDPDVPNSVRFFLRIRGEHVKPWQPWGAFPPTPLVPTPGQTSVVSPTETGRIVFNDAGKVRHYATGLVIGRYEKVNTNGLGATMGLWNAIGYGGVAALTDSPQLRDVFNVLADQFPSLEIPQTKSVVEDIPSWWDQ